MHILVLNQFSIQVFTTINITKINIFTRGRPSATEILVRSSAVLQKSELWHITYEQWFHRFFGVNFDKKRRLQAFSWNHVSDDSKWRRCTWLSKGHFIQKTQWNNHFKKVMILQFLLFIHICSTKCFKVNTCIYNWNLIVLWNIPNCISAKEIHISYAHVLKQWNLFFQFVDTKFNISKPFWTSTVL